MTKNLTVAEITGYKRERFFEKINKENNQPKIPMKIIAAALLALCATALKIKEEVKEEAKSGGLADLPFTAPDCPPKPDTEGVDDAGIFAMIDADGN